MEHKGFAVGFVSERDPSGALAPREGFHAKVVIDSKPYEIRISAQLKTNRKPEQEEMRVWRVLYHHLKSVFEAADTGVMEFRELMMPYIVMPNGQTIADVILPQLDAKLAGRPDRLLESHDGQ